MTELQTIEVRYEDDSGRHVDVHEASREPAGHEPLTIWADHCACCDAENTTVWYNPDYVVKVEYGPSEHDTATEEYDGGLHWTIEVLLLVWLILFVSGGLYWAITNGQMGF